MPKLTDSFGHVHKTYRSLYLAEKRGAPFDADATLPPGEVPGNGPGPELISGASDGKLQKPASRVPSPVTGNLPGGKLTAAPAALPPSDSDFCCSDKTERIRPTVLDYHCDNCGESLPRGIPACPACGVKLNWESIK